MILTFYFHGPYLEQCGFLSQTRSERMRYQPKDKEVKLSQWPSSDMRHFYKQFKNSLHDIAAAD